ncbi:MAG: MBL fold metallo-hydrolase [Acholeplasmatales bacterium]|nr:MBL fold metallo-hydrolase [Acholeplasmatales bacterium]
MIKEYISGDECGIRTNVHVISNENGDAVLVDTSYKFDNILNDINKHYNVKAILITHAHIDHIDGLKFFKDSKIPIYMSKETETAIYDDYLSSYYINDEKTPFKKGDLNIINVKDNDILNLIGYEIKVLSTKGHTDGSLSFVIDKLKIIFTGDTLFRGRHGMTTYLTGNHIDMLDSMNKILSYDDDYIIYAGHYPKTTVSEMKYLKDLNIELFQYGKGFRADTNVYLVSNGDDAILFDTSFEFNKVLDIVNKRYNLKAIFITHSHMDHIDGLKYFKGTNIPIYMSKETEEQLDDEYITSYYMIKSKTPFKKEDLNIINVKDKDVINIIGFDVNVISTPGHQVGATSYNISHALFTGDTIFSGRHAMTTYPTGSEKDMKKTLKKLLSYPKDYYIYPGHDDLVSVGESLFLLEE